MDIKTIIDFLTVAFRPCTVHLFGSNDAESLLFFEMKMKPGEKFWTIAAPRGTAITKFTRHSGTYTFWLALNKQEFESANVI